LFFETDQKHEVDFENEGGETYICGNPPYRGRKFQTSENKADLKAIFKGRSKDTLSLDYVSGWFIKAAYYIKHTGASVAFVSTNSICQGIQVSSLWPAVFSAGVSISFAHLSFKWNNLASFNAGVTVVIIGLSKGSIKPVIFSNNDRLGLEAKVVQNINAYLVAAPDIFVSPKTKVPDGRAKMQFGNHPYYANELMLQSSEVRALGLRKDVVKKFIRQLYGSKELISNSPRSCIWITKEELDDARAVPEIWSRVNAVKKARQSKTKDIQAQKLVDYPYRFRDQYSAERMMTVVPIVSSENRDYLPVGVVSADAVAHNKAFALYDAPLWNMALIASRLHWVWIGTVCVRMRTDFSYSNTLGWNTFPLPKLTEKNKSDLTRCAENILLAREAHFPKTIADLYNPEKMPPNLREAHEQNDETLERIYIGRRFKNDTERLEKLFELYTKMTTSPKKAAKA